MGQEPHRATTRALDILEYLADVGGAGSTLTELAAALDAPKSSLFPIVHTLAERRYIRLDRETGRYAVGISAYALGAAYTAGRNRNALRYIQEVMEDIVERCEETCQLAVLDGRDALYLGKADSNQAIRMISRLGSRLPANGTALGKALLSGLTAEEVRACFPDGLPRLTEHTVTDMDVLLEQLADIRTKGIAWEREESTDHLCCFAVPLRRGDRVFAAISVSMPLFRCTAEKQERVCRCLSEARQVLEHMAEEQDFSLEVL